MPQGPLDPLAGWEWVRQARHWLTRCALCPPALAAAPGPRGTTEVLQLGVLRGLGDLPVGQRVQLPHLGESSLPHSPQGEAFTALLLLLPSIPSGMVPELGTVPRVPPTPCLGARRIGPRPAPTTSPPSAPCSGARTVWSTCGRPRWARPRAPTRAWAPRTPPDPECRRPPSPPRYRGGKHSSAGLLGWSGGSLGG